MQPFMAGTTPAVLLRALYSNGFLSRDQFRKLDESYKLRSQLVHGLVPPKFEPESVHFLTNTARGMLGGGDGRGDRVAG